MRNPRRLVSLAAIWNGCEIRRVRFSKNPVLRHEANQVVIRPFSERHDSTERHVPSDAYRGFCELMRAGVAMKNSDYPARPGFDNHRARIVFRVAGVHHDGNAQVARRGKLLGECPSLLAPRRVVIMVVQAAFPDRHGAFGGELLQPGDVAL